MGMARLLCLLVCLSQETSAWHLFRGGAVPDGAAAPGEGDACGTVPIALLRRPGDFAVGTLEDGARSAVPECPVEDGANASQAGGHAGTFHVLQDGKVAKISKAFQRAGDPTKYLKKHVVASTVEWRSYMEMWCLRRLLQSPEHVSETQKRQLLDHPLEPFVTGGDLAWAPRFYGTCRLDDGHTNHFYIVLQNILGQFNKPCQMDIKLGYMTTEPEYSLKHTRHQLIDMLTPSASKAARVVGFQAWDFVKQGFTKGGKVWSSMQSLNSAFDAFMDAASPHAGLDMLTSSKDSLLRMAAWWHHNGTDALDAIGMSVLMAFECQPQQGMPTPMPVLKLIDFAHMYPHAEHPEWPDNGIDMGMLSTAQELARQTVRLHNTAALREPIQGARGGSTTLKQKCPRPGREIKLTRADCLQYGQERGATYVTWSHTGFLHQTTPNGRCRVCDSLVSRQESILRRWGVGWEWEVHLVD